MPPWLVSQWQLSSCCPWVKLELRHMLGSWQQCWLAAPASMVGNRFVVLAILLRLQTSFHWETLAKAYRQLQKVFVVIVLCAVYVADAFGSRSPLTTTQVMSTPLSKHLQEPSPDELRNRSHIIIRERGVAGDSYGLSFLESSESSPGFTCPGRRLIRQVELNRKPRAFVDTNPTHEPITSGLHVIQDE
jgi:hypothetical protein